MGSGIDNFHPDNRVMEWAKQRAADENITVTALIRRALEREMVANPLVRDPEIQEMVADYLEERCGMKMISVNAYGNEVIGGWI